MKKSLLVAAIMATALLLTACENGTTEQETTETTNTAKNITAEAVDDGIKITITKEDGWRFDDCHYVEETSTGTRINYYYSNFSGDTYTFVYPFVEKGKEYTFFLNQALVGYWINQNVTVTATGGIGYVFTEKYSGSKIAGEVTQDYVQRLWEGSIVQRKAYIVTATLTTEATELSDYFSSSFKTWVNSNNVSGIYEYIGVIFGLKDWSKTKWITGKSFTSVSTTYNIETDYWAESDNSFKEQMEIYGNKIWLDSAVTVSMPDGSTLEFPHIESEYFSGI